jgi:microcystin-dependent protein
VANLIHKNITDPDIHEDRRIATAVDGAVYIADGAGSGAWTVPPSIDPALITLPVGTMIMYAGGSAPTGWILCYGQELSRSTYSALFAVTSTTFGVGNGSTTFNVPDLRGRAVAGRDDMGSVSANRLTSPINGDTLGATGGTQTHTLTTGESPVLTGTTSSDGAHTHTFSSPTGIAHEDSGGVQAGPNPQTLRQNTISLSTLASHTHVITANDSSTSSAHNNTQPSLIFNTIIYTGV